MRIAAQERSEILSFFSAAALSLSLCSLLSPPADALTMTKGEADKVVERGRGLMPQLGPREKVKKWVADPAPRQLHQSVKSLSLSISLFLSQAFSPYVWVHGARDAQVSDCGVAPFPQKRFGCYPKRNTKVGAGKKTGKSPHCGCGLLTSLPSLESSMTVIDS
jgi:hypothetical protein